MSRTWSARAQVGRTAKRSLGELGCRAERVKCFRSGLVWLDECGQVDEQVFHLMQSSKKKMVRSSTEFLCIWFSNWGITAENALLDMLK